MKRFLSTLLAVLMLFACMAGVAEDWTTPYAEPIDVHISVTEPGVPVFAEGESYEDNLWWKLFRERYNINVIVDWTATADEYATKLNLAIASKDLPDMFDCNLDQLNQMINAGLLADLTEAYETTASDSIRKMMEDNWDIVETASRDGKIYGIPELHSGLECYTGQFWTRKDWAEGAGFTGLETIEDIENLMDIYMKDYGATYGIMLDKSLFDFFKTAVLFNAQPSIWLENADGKLVYGSVQPEMKDALAKWAEWYQKGYVRSDFATIDQNACNEDAYNGKVGMYFFDTWAGWVLGQDMVNNQGEGTYFTAYDYPKTVDGEYPKFPVGFLNSEYHVCSADFEHPEILIKGIDAYCDVLNDALGNGTMTIDEVLPFGSNEMHHVTGPFSVAFASYTDAKDVEHAFSTGEEFFHSGYGYLYYQEAKTWADNGDLAGLGRYLQQATPNSSIIISCDHVDRGQINKDAVWGNKPQIAMDYGSTLDDILLEGFTEIIMGSQPLDYFDTLVESWYSAGGAEVEAAVNEMYGA